MHISGILCKDEQGQCGSEVAQNASHFMKPADNVSCDMGPPGFFSIIRFQNDFYNINNFMM